MLQESVQESFGFILFELVFGHTIRGPLKVFKEKWLGDMQNESLLDCVASFKERLHEARLMAKET